MHDYGNSNHNDVNDNVNNAAADDDNSNNIDNDNKGMIHIQISFIYKNNKFYCMKCMS